MGQEFYIEGYGNPPTYFLQSALEECQEARGYTGIFEENKNLFDLLNNEGYYGCIVNA